MTELKRAITDKNLELYKQEMGYEEMSAFEKDWTLMEYENITTEAPKDPNVFLTTRMNKMFAAARKHGVNPVDAVASVVKERGQ